MAVNKRLAKKRAAQKMKEAAQIDAVIKGQNAESEKEKNPGAEMMLTLVVQSGGKEVSMEEAVSRVKNAWLSQGHEEIALEKMEVYIKPEDSAIYYVINCTDTGKVDF